MPIPKTPVSLTVNSGTCQTTYHPGEYFQPAGVIVIVNYDDGTSAYLSSYIYSPQRALTPSDNQITFSYRENGVTVFGYLPITVYSLTSMSLDTSNFHRYNGQYREWYVRKDF